MIQKYQGMIGVTLILVAGLSLSACSGFSQRLSNTASAINPFQQQTEDDAPVMPAPTERTTPNVPSGNSIRVETKPPAPAGAGEVEVNLQGNKACTTFCALPLRKPPAPR